VTRWILEPESRDFDLADLICLTAMTGDEYDSTARLMTRHILPLMRHHHVRYVQIARAGQADDAGYDVLSDSRQPDRMHMRGRWRLSDEQRTAGSVPTFAANRPHLYAHRAKGQVMDWWQADNLAGVPYRHVIGYNARETHRIARASDYGGAGTGEPWYPLVEDWSWTREDAGGYLHEVFGARWERSCCRYCPFQYNRANLPDLIARWRAEPVGAAEALLMERRALGLNPNMSLFSRKPAIDLVNEHELTDVLRIFEDLVETTPSTLYDVRRIRHGQHKDPALPGPVWRSVTPLATGTHRAMYAELRREVGRHAGIATDRFGITGAVLIEPTKRYPALEHRLVIAPEGAIDKRRDRFFERWDAIRHQLRLAA
jgi:hypothetical protein